LSMLSPDGLQLVVSTIRRWTEWGKLVLAAVDGKSWRPPRGPVGGTAPVGGTKDGGRYLGKTRALMGEGGAYQSELWRGQGRPPAGGADCVAGPREATQDCSMAQDGQHVACIQESLQSDLLQFSGLQ